MRRRKPISKLAVASMTAIAAVSAAMVGAVAAPAGGATTPASSADAVGRAAQIGVDVDARYPGLRVTEASSTAVIESLTLFDGADPRVVPADNGIYLLRRLPEPGDLPLSRSRRPPGSGARSPAG